MLDALQVRARVQMRCKAARGVVGLRPKCSSLTTSSGGILRPMVPVLSPAAALEYGVMRQVALCTVGITFLLVAGLGQSQDTKDPYAEFIAQTKPRTPAEERKQFQLPPGFEIQLVASEPDIHKP